MFRAALLLITLYSCNAWRRPLLLHGRLEHGMLPPPGPAGIVGEEQWLPQVLDHFDRQNSITWQQRYFVNASYWTDKANGPVFLMLGGEGPADPVWLAINTDMMRNAEKYGALALMIEHRFYGNSHPTTSLETSNLRYLSSEQALGDIATFHDYIVNKYQLTDNNKWISFGGSYSGALSAWLRIKYPHLIAGAIATSAPVQPELNFVEYLEVVQASLATAKQGADCPNAVRAATAKLDSMLNDPSQLPAVESKFNVKPSLQGMNDIMNLASTLAGNFMGVVQYNRDNRAFEGATNAVTIDDLCDIMTNQSIGDELDRYAAVNDMFLKMYDSDSLDVNYDAYVEFMKSTSWTSPAAEGARQWFYQTCTEFGYYQTSDSDNQPFGNMFPLKFSVQQCEDIFGPQFSQSAIEEGIKWTTINYGGRNVNNTRNIVFPNGSIDPWHALGILQSENMYSPAIFIKGTAHCANMYPPRDEDLQDLVNARKMISLNIGTFLKRQ